MHGTSTTLQRQTDADRFREALADANLPALLPVLVQLTGDLRWLEPPYQPARTRGLDENSTGGLPEAIQKEIRARAFDAILRWRAGKPIARPDPSDDLLVRMLSVSMGEAVPPEYGPMIASELSFGSERGCNVMSSPPPPGFRAIVIGGGVSGIATAIKLKDAGIPYMVIERHGTVGGTWFENRYPGCGVDTPSALYSFSFAPHEWSHHFALRDELHGYLERLANSFDVRRSIRFETEVVALSYDDSHQEWAVTVRGADGSEEVLRANVVISAVGGFSRPKMPSISGLERFEGPCVHTARWPHDLALQGKRVAVIGTGASAMQLVPQLAPDVSSLTIFQRSPQWVAPFEQFRTVVAEPLRFLAAEVPLYRIWYRLRAAWMFNDRIHAALQKDPEWPHPERAVNEVNDAHRRFFTRYIQSELGDRQELLDAVLPDYPPYGKRILLDNGWYRTLRRDNVRLVTDRIVEVEADGLRTETGVKVEVDAIVCATGFDVVRFLAPMDIHGRSGRSIRETWDDDDAKAYLGTVVPDFPNLFIVYGPNTQGGHGGSLIATAESQVHYICDLLRQMFERRGGVVECRQDVYDEYNKRVDAAHEAMIWTHPGMETYYRNSRGRVVVSTPFRVVDYWAMTRRANLDDYIVEPANHDGTET